MKGRRVNYQILLFFGILMLTSRCIEPYNPPAINQVIDILVVDGFMNTTDSTAIVKLSKAIALTDSGDPAPETNAVVRIEDENGTIFPLTEKNEGEYVGQKLIFNQNLKHRLLITTSSQNEVASDFIELRTSPPIDSITWRPNSRRLGVDIFVNTHDSSGSTQYYQWTFKETWEYNAGHYSFLRLEKGIVLPQEKNIYRCWRTLPSTEILINSTTALQADVTRDFELTFIQFPSQKMARKYTIEVEQRALTKEAYAFWLQLKKTTESLGSLFDPLPSQVVGNLKDIKNPANPVLGYFSGGSITKQRKFITIQQLPAELRDVPRPPCPVDTIEAAFISGYADMNLIGSVGSPIVTGYLVSSYTGCMDCRELGGTTTRPDFWE